MIKKSEKVSTTPVRKKATKSVSKRKKLNDGTLKAKSKSKGKEKKVPEKKDSSHNLLKKPEKGNPVKIGVQSKSISKSKSKGRKKNKQ